jgi:hypothetical protein
MRRVVAYALAVLVVSAGTAVAWAATVDVELPRPTGPHAVGRVQGSTARDDAGRIAYTLYHPAVPGTGGPGPYLPPAIADPVAARDLGNFAALDPWSRVDHGLRDGADWADGRFPLIVFSPGADVQPQYYSALLAELASHGFAVAALSHPGLTPFIAYPDGTVATSPDPPMPGSAEEALRQHDARIAAVADDVAAAARHLGQAFAPHLDGRKAAFGHSLGGAGAVAAAVADDSFLAVADLDGSLGSSARGVALGRPVAFMADDGPVPPADATARADFVRGGEPGLRVTLHGAGHMTFATDVGFLEAAVPFQDSDGLPGAQAHRDVARPLVEFFGNALPPR